MLFDITMMMALVAAHIALMPVFFFVMEGIGGNNRNRIAGWTGLLLAFIGEMTVLGWLIDTASMTLRLTPRRSMRLQTLLTQDVPRSRQRVTVKDYHRLLGELRSMAIALPGARGLFSALQSISCRRFYDINYPL